MAADLGESATRPMPSASARARVRFQRVSSKPLSANRPAIAEPILPVPRIAIRGVLFASELRRLLSFVDISKVLASHLLGRRTTDLNLVAQDVLDLGEVRRRELDVGGRSGLADLLRVAGPDDRH